MPIMTRMRESMPIILFGLLIAFLITIIFEWGMDYMGIRTGRQDVVGKVNGKKITYKEFSELLKTFSDNQKAQTGKEPDETQLAQLRDQVWQTMVTQELIAEEIQRLGLTVTDEELRSYLYGETPPEELRRLFVDSTGQFHREPYEQFLQDPNQFIRDPRGVDPNFGVRQLSEFERNLRQQRLREKLQSIVTAAVRVSEGELRQRFADQNQKYDAQYALFDATSLVKDQDVQVTDADLKNYYEENADQFKVEAQRKLSYVFFAEKASGSDSTSRQKDIEDAAAKARSGMDFLQLVFTYSDKPDSGAFYTHGELSPAVESAVFSAAPGAIIGPLLDNDGWHLLKVLAEKKSDKEFVHAAHILFPLEGDTNAVKAEAQSVAKLARGGKDFAALAREYSKDPSSAAQGGELGWFPRNRMVPAFENAVFKAKPGEVVGPLRTQFGLHIVKVYGKDSRELKLAHILLSLAPSSQTKNDIFERAKDFAYNARQSDIAREAQQTGLELKETLAQEKGGVLPGLGMNESVSRWAFKSKVGTVSEPFTLPNGYAVFSVKEIKDAGVRPFDEVKESLRPAVLRKKKAERARQIAADLKAKLAPGDSLTKLAQLEPLAQVHTTGAFTLGGVVPGLGRDPNFAGAVAALKVGEISGAVQSTRGAYIIQLLSKAEFDSTAFASQKEILAARILQDKRSRFVTEWLTKLQEKATIEDNRDIFFR